MAGGQKLSFGQSAIIWFLALILISLLVIIGVLFWPNISDALFHPTAPPEVIIIPTTTTVVRIITTPTEWPTPTTRFKYPTWTFIPTITLMPSLTPYLTKTPVPTNKVSSNPNNGSSSCSAWIDYVNAVHKYNLNYLNSYYDQWNAYYDGLINQAAGERDALGLARIQRQKDALNAQNTSSINNENSRYEADLANVKASCR